MFLTLLFAEHMLPSGLKLSWPWPFVALWSLSCTKGRARWERGEGEGQGPKGQEGMVDAQDPEKLDAGRWSSEPGKTQGSAPACVLPPRFIHTSPRTATSHWPGPGLVFFHPLRLHKCQSADWHRILKLIARHCPAQAMQKPQPAGCARGQGPSREHFFLGGQPWSTDSDHCYCVCILLQNRCSRNAGCEVCRGMKRQKIS